MKNQTQIKRKNNRGAVNAQSIPKPSDNVNITVPLSPHEARFFEARAKKKGVTVFELVQHGIVSLVLAGNGSNGFRSQSKPQEIFISRRCKDRLVAVALALAADPIAIAHIAIGQYLIFVDRHPAIAKAQPAFAKCDAFLGFFPKNNSIRTLNHICVVHEIDACQLANSAIDVYCEWVQRTPESLQFHKDNPDSLDADNIYYLLGCRPSKEAISFLEEILQSLEKLPLREAVRQANGLMGLIRSHPGFELEKEALEMLVEGAERIIG